MKLFGRIEIVLGLLLVGLGAYFLLESLVFPELDRHGWLVVVGNIGVLVGGLLSFAGAMLAFTSRYRWLWHLPFVLVVSIYLFGFSDVLV